MHSGGISGKLSAIWLKWNLLSIHTNLIFLKLLLCFLPATLSYDLKYVFPRAPCAPCAPCSRCTGYRPILDAFKTFTKSDPKAYTEEAIAASKGLPYNGSTRAPSKASSSVCPSTGMPCDCKKAPNDGAAGGVGELCGAEGCGAGGCGAGKASAAPQRPSIDPIFPPELKMRPAAFLHMPGQMPRDIPM